MPGRFYTIPFSAVTVTTALDSFELKAASGKPFILHEIILSQDSAFGDAKAAGIRILIKRATGSYTTGSGGTTPTPTPHNTSDTAAGVTAKVNNTTQAVVGTGTLTTIRAEAMNEQAGWQYLPTPETRIPFMPTEACIVSITAPPASIVMDGSAVVEELG